MYSERTIISKLGGNIGSHPIILTSYPVKDLAEDETKDLLSKCLPDGIKVGEFCIKRYKKHHLISYIFRVEKQEHRDDLFSFSILLHKKYQPDNYTPILKKIIDDLQDNGVLSEEILKDYQQEIYDGINEERDIKIESNLIELSDLFEKVKEEPSDEKPKLKGSFF
ncbi:MAG: hypothetical protein GF317_08880 [Candidatus Lokiarchaeota archaeon]|nr:hypothetical protein [Candidatus Lokiarchaeota archaeon]MBD3199825.1 hypothetical protein [Candidatus Lokiarchaeota archaeon]